MDNKKIAYEILETLDVVMNNELLVNYEDNKRDYEQRIKNYIKVIEQVLNEHYNVKITKGSNK